MSHCASLLISYSFFEQIAGNKLGGRAVVMMRRYLLRLIAVVAVGLCLTPSFARDESKAPLVFAAASLKDALDAINAAWSKESGKREH